MYAFMTSGTYLFLTNLTKKNPNTNIHLMQEGLKTVAYYEASKNKSLFKMGRSYRIMFSIGDIAPTGLITMNSIPVLEDGQKSFEENYSANNQTFMLMPGFVSYRLLKPLKNHIYILLIQWESERYYKYWIESDSYKHSHFATNTRLPPYFADRPFFQKYSLINSEG